MFYKSLHLVYQTLRGKNHFLIFRHAFGPIFSGTVRIFRWIGTDVSEELVAFFLKVEKCDSMCLIGRDHVSEVLTANAFRLQVSIVNMETVFPPIR
jgi:hypothetical protein